jgi:hypothetical protein
MSKVLVEMDEELVEYLLGYMTKDWVPMVSLIELEAALRAAKPAADPFDVDWSKAPGWAKFHAVDLDGRKTWFADIPQCDREMDGWNYEGDVATELVLNWEQSLRRRPTRSNDTKGRDDD